MDMETYLKESTGKSVRQLSLDIGVAQSTLARQLKGERTLTLETLRDISLATNLDFLDLATHAKLITKEHAKQIRGTGALNLATNKALLAELERRLNNGDTFNTEPPLFQPITPEEAARAELAEALQKPDYDLAAYQQTDGDEVDYDSYH